MLSPLFFRKPALLPPAPAPAPAPTRASLEADIQALHLEISRLSSLLLTKQTLLLSLPPSSPVSPTSPTTHVPAPPPPGPPFPIHLLPLELLQHVLLLASLSDPTPLTRTRLGHVSRSFRSALLALPAAWSHISLPLRPSHTPSELALLRTSLTRAKSAPLSVHITYELGTSPSPPSDTPPTPNALDILLAHLPTFHHASLDVRAHPSSLPLLQRLTDALDSPSPLPQLRVLEFRTGVKQSMRLDGLLDALLRGAQGLVELEVWTSGEVPVLPRTLRKLVWGSARPVPLSAVSRALANLPHLASLTLPALDYPSTTTPPPTTIHHPSLTHLSLTPSSPTQDASFLRTLQAPRLTSLELRGEGEGGRADAVFAIVREREREGVWRLETFDFGGLTPPNALD